MSQITFIEPQSFLEPPIVPDGISYLTHIEKCGRISHLSEAGKAEQFVTKVAKKLGHVGIIEHVWHVMKLEFHDYYAALMFYYKITQYAPLFASAIEIVMDGTIMVSGNLRMWSEFLDDIEHPCWISRAIAFNLAQHYPVLFQQEWAKEDKRVSGVLADIRTRECQEFFSLEPMPDNLNVHKFVAVTCRIVGDRSMSHQLVRHRMSSYVQESQRYVNYNKKGFQFVRPNEDSLSDTPARSMEEILDSITSDYEERVAKGVKPEDARGILPNATKTEIYQTATLEAWEHIMRMRALNKHAQQQIRDIMLNIKKKIQTQIPSFMKGE